MRSPHPGNATWVFGGAALAFAWLSLCNRLRVDWSVNDQYQYGWFVAPLALALLALRWGDRPSAAPDYRLPAWVLLLASGGCLLLLFPVGLTEVPNPDWRLLFWLHAALLVAISLIYLQWIGGWPWVRHFAFPIGFLLLAVPWPSVPEQAIVQSLMRVAAAISAEGMNLLGIPAQAHGNLIQIRDQMVGVDEACSGIRSLQTMLMAGLLFGELSRLTWGRRLLLLVGGLAIAMLANIFRCSLLVWIAARYGTAVFERFHDLAGICVLVIVFGGLLLLNRWFSRARRVALPAVADRRGGLSPRPVPWSFLLAAAIWLLASEVGAAIWYGTAAPAQEQPLWTVTLPSDAPGFENVRIDDRSRRLLRFDEGLSARWNRPGALPSDCTLFFFRWEPGHASSAQAEMHQPHICLTAAGLTQIADWGVTPLHLPNGITLPVRRYQFAWNGRSIYVFFVVWQDGANTQPPPDSFDSPGGETWFESCRDRFRAVLERRSSPRRQTLEFIEAGPTTAAQAAEQFNREVVNLIRPTNGVTRN